MAICLVWGFRPAGGEGGECWSGVLFRGALGVTDAVPYAKTTFMAHIMNAEQTNSMAALPWRPGRPSSSRVSCVKTFAIIHTRVQERS